MIVRSVAIRIAYKNSKFVNSVICEKVPEIFFFFLKIDLPYLLKGHKEDIYVQHEHSTSAIENAQAIL